jgi:hypothetical protein
MPALNRGDFLFAAKCWETWKMSVHHGLIAPRPGRQPSPAALVSIMQRFASAPISLHSSIASNRFNCLLISTHE